MNKKAFDDYPLFYELDNRKFRPLNPVTKESLENRHEAMFQEWNIVGKSVLDIGCCLGATGQWVLFNGAKSYTGVEIQEEYAKDATQLLAHHGDKAHIINSSIEDFFKNNTETYDIVTLFGVLYSFVDYYSILKQVSMICNEYIFVDSLYPAITEQGNPLLRLACAVTLLPNQRINVAGTKHSLSGAGTRISPKAMNFILNTLGFAQVGGLVYPKNTNGSYDAYNGNVRSDRNLRFLARYRKSEKAVADVSKLLNNVEDEHVDHEWVKDRAPVPTNTQSGNWKFDDTVSTQFQDIAETNIPNYSKVIDKCLQIAKRTCKKDSNILDIGCALGHTLEIFHQSGFTNLYGVDNSQSMLDKCFKPSITALSDNFPVEFKEVGFDMIMANWTLHFVKERKQYIQDIYDAMNVAGVFVLSDKMLSSELVHDLYHDFKRNNGLSEKYIIDKANAIKGVLIQYPMDWYLTTLHEVGFKDVQIIDAGFSFNTFYAKK